MLSCGEAATSLQFIQRAQQVSKSAKGNLAKNLFTLKSTDIVDTFQKLALDLVNLQSLPLLSAKILNFSLEKTCD